ncbi:unnamed protein product [Allacma fusca]|uniref:Uncharacterized protein n=1 Tax=Allacma fusca TaxID=39272 RepID=A0A8J2P9Y8_9HEXA|nr:unnamed protein product [Allacma fusca]
MGMICMSSPGRGVSYAPYIRCWSNWRQILKKKMGFYSKSSRGAVFPFHRELDEDLCDLYVDFAESLSLVFDAIRSADGSNLHTPP